MVKRCMVWITAILCGCLLIISCGDNDEQRSCPPIIDNTLAGSIYIPGAFIKAEGVYNGTTLTGLQYYQSRLIVKKVSDTEVYLYCIFTWDKIEALVTIPKIALSGKPFDVTFDCRPNNVKVVYDGITDTSVPTSVKGWIKRVDNTTRVSSYGSDASPFIPDYSGEITINCTLRDGKMLSLVVTSWSLL